MTDNESFPKSSAKTGEKHMRKVGVCMKRDDVILCGNPKDIKKIMDILDAQNVEQIGSLPDKIDHDLKTDDQSTPDAIASHDAHADDPGSDLESQNSDDWCPVTYTRPLKAKQ